MARPAKADAQKTRQNILESAYVLFSKKGQLASIRDIAGQSKVSLATILHYYKSKDGLYLACVENMYKDRGKKVPDWVAKARKAGSPIGLPKHIQRELLLANLYQQEQSVNLSKKSGGKPFDIMERAFENMDFSELWAKKHWAGAADEYESKIQQFQRDKERFKF